MFACGYSGVRVAAFFERLAHFLVSVVKVGVVTAEASQSEELREWDGIFYDVAFVKIRFWSVVVGEKFVFMKPTKRLA